MCDTFDYPKQYGGASRRRFLRLAGLASLSGLAAGPFATLPARADALTKAQRERMTPDQIIEVMKQGNARFQRGERKARNYLREQKASASGQYPAAVLLSCIDSRAPAEVIMDLGIGDIFNCRVAGNVENSDILGSMEFACKLSGAKVVVVMGHTACGAIKGAIANAELGNLTGLLARIKPAVQATRYDGERSATNYAFVDAVARKNVELTIDGIRRHSAVLAELESAGTIRIVGAMYNLGTGALEFLG
ncbi:carbonic anhydrase family protein [Burkholderia ubonensis]|uniref:Carbonic anhydrase n=1 Tax=Burkholderia ubonensis subsp. mesacidophila TaxID=265293 RepID=A0A2A4FIV2_9BURK|nr:carbonic anhydrase family protein [Burkholderia ubonensis]PCE32997.1 carbonic anhydrase [Burkholderia ubonensis subsp. mesacidophila]